MPGRVQASGRSGAVKTAPRETDMNYNTDESKKSMTPEETAKPSYWAVLPAGIRVDETALRKWVQEATEQ